MEPFKDWSNHSDANKLGTVWNLVLYKQDKKETSP